MFVQRPIQKKCDQTQNFTGILLCLCILLILSCSQYRRTCVCIQAHNLCRFTGPTLQARVNCQAVNNVNQLGPL